MGAWASLGYRKCAHPLTLMNYPTSHARIIDVQFDLGVTSDCSKTGKGGPYTLVFSSASLIPDPPVKGQPAELIANSTAGNPTAVSGGKGTLTAFLDGVLVYTSPPIEACGSTKVDLPLGVGILNIQALPCTDSAPLAPNTATSISMSLDLNTAPRANFGIIIS